MGTRGIFVTTFPDGCSFLVEGASASLLSSGQGRRGLEGTTRNVFKVHIFHFVNQVSSLSAREVTSRPIVLRAFWFCSNSARGTTFVTKPKRPASAASIGFQSESIGRTHSPDEFRRCRTCRVVLLSWAPRIPEARIVRGDDRRVYVKAIAGTFRAYPCTAAMIGFESRAPFRPVRCKIFRTVPFRPYRNLRDTPRSAPAERPSFTGQNDDFYGVVLSAISPTRRNIRLSSPHESH